MSARWSFAAAIACAAHAHGASAGVEPDPLASLLLRRLDAQDRPTCVAVATISATARTAFACTKDAGPARLDRDSIFEIGSVSKAFTGVLLAEMVRRGDVALADPVSKYAPAGVKLPRGAGPEITLADLVTHTAGLPRLPPGFEPPDLANPYESFDTKALYEALARTELAHDVGAKREYSNFGFLWLSELLGRAAGKPYDRLLAERVLAPLGMADTAVRLSTEQAGRFVQGHSAQYRKVAPWDVDPALAGVGGLRASLADLATFAAAAAGRRDSPLAEAFALSYTAPKPGSTAFGWGVVERASGRIYAHNGETGGFHAMLAVNPAQRTAAVVLADSANNLDDLALHLVDPAFALRRKREAIALDAAKLDEYAGEYRIAPQFVLRVFRADERLMSQATGQEAFEIFAEAPDRFFLRTFDAQLTFRRGPDGRVESLLLHQGGRETPAKRVP